MVVIFLPATADVGVMHERNGAPSTCTVQAPHCAMPQPNFVPVNPTRSRSTQSSGMSGGASTVCVWPFMFKVVIGETPIGFCLFVRENAGPEGLIVHRRQHKGGGDFTQNSDASGSLIEARSR